MTLVTNLCISYLITEYLILRYKAVHSARNLMLQLTKLLLIDSSTHHFLMPPKTSFTRMLERKVRFNEVHC
jgi:hypothetical protein